MSGALAVAAVSAVLKDLLDNRVAKPDIASSVGDVTVTALPPIASPSVRTSAASSTCFSIG